MLDDLHRKGWAPLLVPANFGGPWCAYASTRTDNASPPPIALDTNTAIQPDPLRPEFEARFFARTETASAMTRDQSIKPRHQRPQIIRHQPH